MWQIQFHHGYFGWLTLDAEYLSEHAAKVALAGMPKCYKRRIVRR